MCTHFAQERRAAHHVERQGFEFYLPEMLNGKRRERLFPNYLFVFVRDQWRVLLGTRGIRRMIMVDETPVRMPKRDIDALRQRENEHGVIVLPPPFSRGQAITIRGGVFKDCFGIVDGMPAHDRVNVLLEMLGRKVEIEVDRRMVAAA